MSTTDNEPSADRRRWWYMLLLLILVILCLIFLGATGRLPGIGAGGPTATPTTIVDITEVTDQPTETETEKPTETEQPTETETEPPGTGVCLTPCDPAKPSCDPKLSCVKDNLGKYVCWGGTDSKGKYCGPTATEAGPGCECRGADYICTNADGSIASASYNSTACGGGGQCECRGPDLACPDGTYAQFNPACMATGKCTCVYNYSTGQKYCKETGASCN
jgi:hypothetical protein